MDIEYTLRCQYCQLGFETSGDLTMHSCVEIKQENIERQYLHDEVDFIDQNATKNGNQFDESKVSIFDPGSDLAEVKMEETEEVEETKPLKLKKSRKRPKISSQLDLLGFPPQLGDDYELPSNFQLNEDVEKPTLNKKPKRKLVMCRICNKTFEGNYKLKRHEKIHIKNGEIIPPDKVSESKTIIETLEPITEIETQEAQDFKVEEHYDLEYSDLELSEEFLTTIIKYVDDLCDIISNGDPNLVRTLEVNQNLNDAVNCYKNELEVKRQFLEQSNEQRYYNDEAIYYSENDNLDKKDKVGDVDQSPKKKRGKYKKKKLSKREEKKLFSKSKGEFVNFFSKIGKSSDIEKLFPYLKYDIGEDMFICCLCKRTSKLRHNMLTHIKTQHMNDITINLLNSEPKDDCVYGTCRKVYSESCRQLWCIKCKDLPVLKRKNKQILKVTVCTICGNSTKNISGHLKSVHEVNEQICPHCDKVLQNPSKLKGHINQVHIKRPCAYCGELIPVSVMNEHIRAQHTSNKDKRHKCDVCGKGFNDMGPFKDHKNIHTGEKPYKCKYCSACFASRGNHRQHEKTHIGEGRKHNKK